MRRKLNKKKIIFLISIALLIICAITFTILYNNNDNVRGFFDHYIFRKNVTENSLPKISTENSYSFAFDNYIVCLENNILTFYNKSANKISSLDIEISNPIFEQNNNYLCIAEKNGNKIYLINNKNIVWQKDIEGAIRNIAINKHGYVAISIADTTYKTICKLYDENGAELFTTYLSESYIIDSAISDNSKSLALAEINTSGIAIQSNIKIISIDKAKSNSANTIEYSFSSPIDDFLINIDFQDNNLVCIYDKHIDTIKDNSITEINNFNNTDILFADINNKLIQIEKKNTGILSSEFELQIIDISSRNKKTYLLKREPVSVKVNNGIIAVNFGTEILFINTSGWLINRYTSSQEIQDIVLTNKLAGIVFKNKIEILSF